MTEPVYLEFSPEDAEAVGNAVAGDPEVLQQVFSHVRISGGTSKEDEREIAVALAAQDSDRLRTALHGRQLLTRAPVTGATYELDTEKFFDTTQTSVRKLSDDDELRHEDFDRITDALEPRDGRSVAVTIPNGTPPAYARADAFRALSKAVLPRDKNGNVKVSGSVELDSAQLRYINGTSQRMNLPYVLDTRLNSMLDSGGTHLLIVETVFRDVDGEAIVKAFAWVKLAYVAEPVNVWLAVRIKDWVQLKEFHPPLNSDRRATRDPSQFNLTMNDVQPDDRTVWGNP